jgi:hypothetical protein
MEKHGDFYGKLDGTATTRKTGARLISANAEPKGSPAAYVTAVCRNTLVAAHDEAITGWSVRVSFIP